MATPPAPLGAESPLLELPPEVLARVAECLGSWRDVRAFRAVCRATLAATAGDALWQALLAQDFKLRVAVAEVRAPAQPRTPGAAGSRWNGRAGTTVTAALGSGASRLRPAAAALYPGPEGGPQAMPAIRGRIHGRRLRQRQGEILGARRPGRLPVLLLMQSCIGTSPPGLHK